ncbi:hypothetical protein [Pseudomonas sp. 58 R 3]|uniref:hypothetical protein n=1 Tax=Pseudomonas sp. 58 R 3 TaxID=1844108 RepID=UPI0009F5D663|nr:hypothetical protein [Pseudomonas sp. 58 R 3]
MSSGSDPRIRKERKAVYADLKAEYLYILIPFILLVAVKLYIGVWKDIVLSADWSLISCIVFGQVTFKISKAVAKTKRKTSEQHYGLYTAKRFLLVVVSAAFYFGMISKPSLSLGFAQFGLFLLATFLHFSDGYTVYLLQRDDTSKSSG